MTICCPHCGANLSRCDRSYRCENGHSFDIARQGYVNLLSVERKHSRHPGDTREQVLSRREFLEAGYYAPISEALNAAARDYAPQGEILDVGCGEGYYAVRLAQTLNAPLTGLDISKEAVRCAAGKYKDALWICGTAAHIPVADGSAAVISSLFALTEPGEFSRILQENGIFLQVLAGQDHLMGLKNIIYPEIKLKEKDSVPELPGFRLLESRPIRFTFTLEGAQIHNLLSMTPHLFRISREGAQRLQQTQRLTDTASCVLNIYRKI